MAKDPAMLFYTSDFLTGVALMSMKERGQYITLICLQQQRGHMALKDMKKAVGAMSEELMSKFVIDENGNYYNRRADEEIKKRASYRLKQKEKIEARWNKSNTANGNTTVSKKEYYGITTVIPLENEIEKENINNKKIEIDREYGGKEEKEKKGNEAFDAFWTAYPRKVGKGAAKKAFEEVPKSKHAAILRAIEAQKKSEQWQKENGKYIPNPATWLNQERWEDELAERKSAADTSAFNTPRVTREELEQRKRLIETLERGDRKC